MSQDYANKELLVVDGLSTDSTMDIVRSFPPNSIRFISEKDQGIYDAMNKGLKHYSGDAVGFLNSDDTFHDNGVLTKIAEALGDADAVYGDLDMVKANNRNSVSRVWKSGPFRPGAFRKGWMPPHPTFYLRRHLATAVGLFRTDFRISSDYDFMLRALELHKPRVRYIPHTLVDFTLGGRSTGGIRAVIDGNLECLQARREHLGAGPLDVALFLKPLRKLVQLRKHG